MTYFTENGINFGLIAYPVCLPTTSNEDPNKWKNRHVEVLGFAATNYDFSGSKGDVLKVAEMDVFTQSQCNVKLKEKFENNQKCKYTLIFIL